MTDTPATGTDLAVVQREVGKVPGLSAESLQHVGRYSGALVLACFEQMGGLQRMTQWADHNPTDFYTKLLPKIISRTTQVDISGSVTIDEAISRLEGSRDAVDAEFTEIREKTYDL
jgi:hypothetical protein